MEFYQLQRILMLGFMLFIPFFAIGVPIKLSRAGALSPALWVLSGFGAMAIAFFFAWAMLKDDDIFALRDYLALYAEFALFYFVGSLIAAAVYRRQPHGRRTKSFLTDDRNW